MKIARLIRIGLMFTAPVFVATSANYLNYAVGTSLNNDISKASDNVVSSYSDESVVTNLKKFNEYDPIYGGTTYQTIATEDGTIGLSSDKKTLILTGYNGAIIWANNLTKDTNLINWGKNNNVTESQIQTTTINSYVKMYGKDRLVVLLGYTVNYNYNYLININLKTGRICSSNGAYAISKVGSGYRNMVVETSDPNKFAVISNKDSTWTTTSENNTPVISHTPEIYTVSDGSITSNSSTLPLKIPHENFSGGGAKFLGYVAGKINSNTNYLFFANVTSDNNGGTSTSNLFYIVVDNNFNLPNNQVLTSVILNDTGSSSTIKDYRKTSGLYQFVSIGDRTTNINTIKVALPYYISNATGTDETAYGGIVVSEITTQSSATNCWKKDTKITNAGPIVQMSVDNNNVYASFDYISGSLTSGKTITKSAVINVKDVTSNNNANWKIARTGWASTDAALTNNNDTIVAIPNANDDSNFKFVLRNKVYGRFDLYYTTYQTGSTTELVHTEGSTVTKFASPKIKVDPNQSLANDTSIKSNYIASAIPDDTLLNKFQYKEFEEKPWDWKQSTIKELWGDSQAITNKNANDDAGTLSFDYKVTYTPLFDNTKQLSYYVSASLTGLYKLTNIRKFEFVTDADTTGKWAQIVTLKQTKTAKQITVDDVKNYFIDIDAIDKNNTAFTSANLTASDIILNPSTDGTSLEITVNLPASNFPTTGSTANAKFTKTATFDNFKSDASVEAAKYAVNINTNYDFGGKFPSTIKITDLINTAITFGSDGYDNVAADSWTGVGTRDNINGTITVTSITTSDTSIPEKYRNLLWNTTAPITFSTRLLNTPSAFTMDSIKISNITDTSNLLKPSEIWSEYEQAVNSNDTNKLQSNLLYKAVQWNENRLLFERSDLVLSLVNADDTNKTLSVSATIKENAKLNYTIGDAETGGNVEVRFTNEYKQKAISLGKAVTKPFNLTVSVDEIQKLDVNQQFLTDNNINYDSSNLTLTADLNNGSISNITKNLTVKIFSDSFDTYKTDILKMFDYSDKYVPEFSNTTFDINSTSVSFNVTFNLQNPNQYPNSVKTRTYIININNFKAIPTVTVDNDYISKNNIGYDNNQTLTVDLANTTIGSINKDTTLFNFKNNFDNYKDQLLVMFKYDSYQPTLTLTSNDLDKNIASVKVDFNLNDNNYPTKSQSFIINISNFKETPVVTVNIDYINKNNISYDGDKTLSVNLTNTTIGSISKETSLTNFKNNFDSYKNELLAMFNYDIYQATLTLSNYDFNTNSASVKVDFDLNDSNYPAKSQSFIINISNFKGNPVVSVNNNFVNSNNISYDNVSTLTIDLNKTSINSINNKMNAADFINSFDTLQNDLLPMFDYSGYSPNWSLVNPNVNSTSVTINAEFNLTDTTNYQPNTQVFTIKIVNFKVVLDVTVDQDILDNNHNVEYTEGSGSVVIDVSKNQLFNMNNSVTYDDFVNNFESTYQNSILEVFDWSQYYTPVVSDPIVDKNNKTVYVEIVFTLNENVRLNSAINDKPDKINMSVTIIGFKEPTLWKIIKIAAIILIALIILVLITYYSIAIRKGRQAIVDDPSNKPAYMIDETKEKEDK